MVIFRDMGGLSLIIAVRSWRERYSRLNGFRRKDGGLLSQGWLVPEEVGNPLAATPPELCTRLACHVSILHNVTVHA